MRWVPGGDVELVPLTPPFHVKAAAARKERFRRQRCPQATRLAATKTGRWKMQCNLNPVYPCYAYANENFKGRFNHLGVDVK